MNTSRLPSQRRVSVTFADSTPAVMLFAVFTCAAGCDAPSKPTPATPGNPGLPRLTLRANDLLDRPISLSTVAITPAKERLVGEWKFRNEATVVSIEWLPYGHVEAPVSKSPDGMLRIRWRDSNLDRDTGSDTFEVVLNSANDTIEIYESGTVNSDGSHPADYLGTAMLVGDNLIKVEATLNSRFCTWDIDSTFVRQEVPNEALSPSDGSGEN